MTPLEVAAEVFAIGKAVWPIIANIFHLHGAGEIAAEQAMAALGNIIDAVKSVAAGSGTAAQVLADLNAGLAVILGDDARWLATPAGTPVAGGGA